MPYKPTGNPPGRPRKHKPEEAAPEPAAVVEGDTVQPETVRLRRAQRAWRAHYDRLREQGDGKPIFNRRGRYVGKRPTLFAVKG